MPSLLSSQRFGAATPTAFAACGIVDLSTTTINTTYPVVCTDGESGQTFQPKAIIAWLVNRTGTPGSGNIGAVDILESIGIAVSTSSRRCTSGSYLNNNTTMNINSATRTDCLIQRLNNAGASAGRVDVDSFNANGFTLILDEALGAACSICWFAVGGSDITNVDLHSWSGAFPAGTGNRSKTGMAFQPDFVFMIFSNLAGDSTTGANRSLGIGAMAAAGDQYTSAWGSQDNAGTSVEEKYMYFNECISGVAVNGTGPLVRASFVSMNSDGYTVNVAEAGFTNRTMFALAIKGGHWKIGSFARTNSVTDIAVTGLGFKPKGLLCLGAYGSNVQNTGAFDGAMEFGAAVSPTQRICSSVWRPNGQAVSAYSVGLRDDAVLGHQTAQSTWGGLCDHKSFDSDGFTMRQDVADASLTINSPYIAFG